MTKKKVTEKDLLDAKSKWDEAREEAAYSRGDMLDLIQRAVEEGMPQAEIARTLGWPRQRVSKLL
jgi:hypothetical protein